MGTHSVWFVIGWFMLLIPYLIGLGAALQSNDFKNDRWAVWVGMAWTATALVFVCW